MWCDLLRTVTLLSKKDEVASSGDVYVLAARLREWSMLHAARSVVPRPCTLRSAYSVQQSCDVLWSPVDPAKLADCGSSPSLASSPCAGTGNVRRGSESRRRTPLMPSFVDKLSWNPFADSCTRTVPKAYKPSLQPAVHAVQHAAASRCAAGGSVGLLGPASPLAFFHTRRKPLHRRRR